MIEFKFSCTNCGQHIQCNDAYCGLQIICPTCKNQIVVPPAPGTIPARAAMPPPPPILPQTTAAPANFPPPLNAKGKSKTKLIVICGVAGLIFVGVIAYVFFSNAFSRSGETATGVTVAKPAAQKKVTVKKSEPVASSAAPSLSDSPAPKAAESVNDSRIPSASEIVRKVTEQHDSLTSYSAKGKAVSIIDMSGMDLAKVAGAAGNEKAVSKDAEEMKKAMSTPQRMESDFSVKLGKPDFYRVEWGGQMGPVKSKGAVWSSGDGDFLLMDMGQTKYAKMKSRELALASATGLSGGAANTMPQIFFKGQSSLLNLFKDATRGEDETIDGEDCYVVTGNAMGLTVHLWVNKSNYLIKQKQQVLGGNLEVPEMSDAQMEEGLKKLGGNPTAKQKEQMKESMKKMKALTSQVKGTMTETYDNIEINQPVTKTDFNYEVPPGTKMSSSLY